jgi:hypothetical protein
MTETIEQTVNISADRRIHFDIPAPSGLSHGQVKVFLRFEPLYVQNTTRTSVQIDDELARELEKAEAIWAYNRAHPEEVTASLERLRKDGPLFGGVDGVEFQRKIRDEWEDR